MGTRDFNSDDVIAGRLVLGASSPATPLHVQHDGADQGTVSTGEGNFDAVGYVRRNTNAGGLLLGGTTSGQSAVISPTGSDLALLLVTFVGGLPYERVRVTADGKVGIGASSPGVRLHVNGAESDTVGTPNAILGIGLDSGTTPLFGFRVTETGGKLALDYRSGGANHNSMVWDRDGKVGIGTATPSEKLEVNGNIKLSGTVISAGSAGNGVILRDRTDDYLAICGGSSRVGTNGGGLIQLIGNTKANDPGCVQFLLGQASGLNPKFKFYDNTADPNEVEIAEIDKSGNLRAAGNIGNLGTGRDAVDNQGYCLYG